MEKLRHNIVGQINGVSVPLRQEPGLQGEIYKEHQFSTFIPVECALRYS